MHALSGISLSIGPGMFGLLGPNEAGKTTLMRILAGIARPTAGEVTVGGHSLAAESGRVAVKDRLGYLPQELGVYPELTARQFLDYMGVVVSTLHLADGVRYRVVGEDVSRHPDAKAVPPSVEDGYLWSMHQRS